MPMTPRSPLQNGRLRARHLEFQAARPSRTRRLRRHGRRHVDADREGRPPHHLARARKRAEELHRGRCLRSAQAEDRGADRSAAELHALELAGGHPATSWRSPIRCQKVGQKPAGFELFDISVPETAEVDRLLRLLRAVFARRASAVVLRRRIRAHGVRRGRLQTDASARRPVLPDLRRAQSVKAGRGRAAGGCPARARATTCRRRRAIRRLDRGFRAHNTNVYPQRPDRCYLGYIDGGMFIMDISDKSRPKTVSQLGQFAALSRLHAHHAAAVRPRAAARDRQVDRGQCQGLAEADLDARCARRDQPGADRDLPAARRRRLCKPRRALRRAQHP